MKSQTHFQRLPCSQLYKNLESRYLEYIESFLEHNTPFILQIIYRIDSSIEIADIIVSQQQFLIL